MYMFTPQYLHIYNDASGSLVTTDYVGAAVHENLSGVTKTL